MESVKQKITHFGKEYVWQLSGENDATMKQIAVNWKNIGHSVIHKKDKAKPGVTHLYASRLKTRQY